MDPATLVRGDPILIAGLRGTFKFERWDGKSVHCHGGTRGREMARAAAPGKVRRATRSR